MAEYRRFDDPRGPRDNLPFNDVEELLDHIEEQHSMDYADNTWWQHEPDIETLNADHGLYHGDEKFREGWEEHKHASRQASGRCPACRGVGTSVSKLRQHTDDVGVQEYLESNELWMGMNPEWRANHRAGKPIAPPEVACNHCLGTGLVSQRPGGEHRGSNKSRLIRKKFLMDPASGFGANYKPCPGCGGAGYQTFLIDDPRKPRDKRTEYKRRCLECAGTGNVGTVPCYWGGERVRAHQVQQDRIWPNGGYRLMNIVPACAACNEARNVDSFALTPKMPRTITFPTGVRDISVPRNFLDLYPQHA